MEIIDESHYSHLSQAFPGEKRKTFCHQFPTNFIRDQKRTISIMRIVLFDLVRTCP